MLAHEERPYEDRFFAQAPPRTNAQAAATRVYNKNGILMRSDPFVAAADRHGKPFRKTKWHELSERATTPPQQTQPRAAPLGSRSAPGSKEESADPVAAFRRKVLQRGGSGGIHSLGRIFGIMDDDGNRRLNLEELKTGLRDYGMVPTKGELEELIHVIGKGRPISFDEFLVAVRGQLNRRRLQMIDMAYRVLDTSGDGIITVEDVRGRFSVQHHPDVLSGKIQTEEALHHFLSNFDSLQRDGVISKNEFIEYYKNVSASIDDDDYFELMMRNAWHIPGGEGVCANTANTCLLVVHNDGTQKVVMLKNDLGLNVHDNTSVMRALREQGVTDVAKFSLSGSV